MSKNKKIVLTLVILLAIGGVAWALLPQGPDPQMAKVQELQEKLFTPDNKMPEAERRQAFGELREAAEKLTPEQRTEMWRNSPMAKRMQQQVVAYFDLPEKERVAALDKEIDRMEKFRKEMEKRRASGEGRGGPGGGGPPGGFNRGNTDQNQQNERRKQMLDNSSPQERAMFGEYFRAMQERRQQRGLPGWGPR